MEGKEDSRRKHLEEILKKVIEKKFQNAFEGMVRAFQDDIYRYCYYRLEKDEALASDIAQDIFLAAWKGLPKFKYEHGVDSIPAWLFKIAGNKVIDARIVRSKESVRYGGDSNEEEGPSPGIEQPGQKILLSGLRRALMKLNRKDREVLLLAAKRYSAEEITEFLEEDITPEGVRTRLHRARKNLRKELDDE